MVDIDWPTQMIYWQAVIFINHNFLLVCATHRKVWYILFATNIRPWTQCYTTKNTVWSDERKRQCYDTKCFFFTCCLTNQTHLYLWSICWNLEFISQWELFAYRVLNGCSPLCVKLNLPATGHLTGTGFLAANDMK